MKSPRLWLSLILISFVFLNICTIVWAANHQSFLSAHTIDPRAHPNYRNWNKNDWIRWMNAAEGARRRANPRGVPLPDKPLNTVLVAGSGDIRNAFAHNTRPYGNNNVWSNRRFEAIVFQRVGRGRWRIFRTPGVYAAAALDGQRRPVHLQTIFNATPRRGNANFPYRRLGTEIA